MVYTLALGSAVTAGYSVYILTAILLCSASQAAYRLRFEARLTAGSQGQPLQIVRRIAMERVLKTYVAGRAVKLLSDAGVRRAPDAAFWLVVSVPIGLALLTFLLGSVVAAAVPVIAVVLGINAWLNKRAGDRLKKFSEQLPSVFKSVAAALRAGSSIQQALVHTADQISSPAQEELAAVNETVALGMPVDEALSGLYQRLPAVELNFILMGLSIQRRIGGNLVNLLLETTRAIEERRRLQRHLTVETAQARLSARVIGFLPVVITGLIAVIDPAFIAPLFTTSTGLAMLAVAVIAETAGFLLLGQILDIKI